MAMIRTFRTGLIGILTIPLVAVASTNLELTPADLERLGVTLEIAESITEAEIASGPAKVVIPPAQETIVTSTVSGILARVLVAEGDTVDAGQPVAEIVSTELLQLQREFIEAALAVELAEAQAERDSGLHRDGIVAERRVLESAATLRSATTQLAQSRQQLTLAGMPRSAIERLLDAPALNPNLILTAPFTATVIEQTATLGAHIDALDSVYRIADLSELWLEMRVPQERATRIRPGMTVAVATAAGERFGTVSLIGRVTDDASQTVLVRALIGDADGILRAGQVLAARILDAAAEQNGSLAVPSAAIVRSDGRAHVFASDQGAVSVIPVEVLGEDGARTYIRGDLVSGVRVAVGGTASLKSVWLSAMDEGE